MTDERWEEFIETAKQQFQEVRVSSERGEEADETIDVVTFELAKQVYKIERQNRPVVLEKKQHYSHRQGDTARTEYVLSDTEFSHKIKVYKENMYGDWEEVSATSLGL